MTLDRHGGTRGAVVSGSDGNSFGDIVGLLNAGLPAALVVGRLAVDATPTAGSTWNVSDRAARLLGKVSADAGALWDVSDRAGRLLGTVSPVAGSLWDVSDRAGRLLGTVSPAAGSLWDVSDRAGRLLGAVSPAAASLWDVSDRAARALGAVSPAAASLWDVSDRAARLAGQVHEQPSTLPVFTAGAANAIATLTLPAAGAGLFHYITYLRLSRVSTAALAGGALLTVTSTNLGGLTWRTGNTMGPNVSDTKDLVHLEFTSPWKVTAANTATTIVCPAAGAAVSWDLEAWYYTGP